MIFLLRLIFSTRIYGGLVVTLSFNLVNGFVAEAKKMSDLLSDLVIESSLLTLIQRGVT